MLVAGIHLQHVVHGGNAAEEVAFLHLRDPGNHQLLAGSELGSERFGLLASRADFLRIAAVESDPGPGDGEIRIFFHGCAPVVVAALKIEILVVVHALLIKLARLGGRGRDRQRRGLSLS